MEKSDDKTKPFSISQEAQDEAKDAVSKAFGSLTEHIQRIAEDFAEFDRQRQEMRRRMANGARRTGSTSRRIV
jgi:hypothetical protein